MTSFWCALRDCVNHEPRRSAGIPLGWLRVAMGVSGGRAHYVTVCSVECLRRVLAETPEAFTYDERIDRARGRVERARQRAAAPFNTPRVTREGAA